jgi:hypothetical protein
MLLRLSGNQTYKALLGGLSRKVARRCAISFYLLTSEAERPYPFRLSKLCVQAFLPYTGEGVKIMFASFGFGCRETARSAIH